MSKTPRTDELSRQINGYAYVPSIFARELERENGKDAAEIKRLREAREVIRNAAFEEAALLMLSRKVSASEFYAAELRKLKSEEV